MCFLFREVLSGEEGWGLGGQFKLGTGREFREYYEVWGEGQEECDAGGTCSEVCTADWAARWEVGVCGGAEWGGEDGLYGASF